MLDLQFASYDLAGKARSVIFGFTISRVSRQAALPGSIYFRTCVYFWRSPDVRAIAVNQTGI